MKLSAYAMLAAALREANAAAAATGLDYHNRCYADRKALERALEALRKIAGCGYTVGDLHARIAAIALEDVEAIRAGRTPRRDVAH